MNRLFLYYRYYENRLSESPEFLENQMAYEVCKKLVELIEASETKAEDVEALLAYAKGKKVSRCTWIDVLHVINQYRIFLRGESSSLFN